MTLETNLLTAGLPIESATETGTVVWQRGVSVTNEQIRLCSDMILQYIDPTGYTNLLAYRADLQTMKDAYTWALSRTATIRDQATWTNAEVIQAVRDLARIVNGDLKLEKQQIQSGNGALTIPQRL